MPFTSLLVLLLAGSGPELMIPEGTILPVILNEKLNTAKVQENDPILLSLAEDIRASGHRGPVLIPRGSSVVGRIVKSERAGHFIGRSSLDIQIQEIITPTGEAYDGVSAKIVDVAKKKGEKGEVKADGGIQGPVHRMRDTFFLLFPPTTLFQLLATPKRGPDVVLPVETRLYVKLMTPIYVETTTRTASVSPPATSLPQSVPQAMASVAPVGPVQVPSRISQQVLINGQIVHAAFVTTPGSQLQSFTCPAPQHYATADNSSQGWACLEQATGIWLLNAVPPAQVRVAAATAPQPVPVPKGIYNQAPAAVIYQQPVPSVVYAAPAYPVIVAPAYSAPVIVRR